jgi:integrase
MSALAGHVGDYLRLRRALGFKLTRQGEELAQLARFCEAAGAGTLTADLVIAWARQSRGAPAEWAHRLATARGFARYLATIDPEAQIPPTGVFPRAVHRRAPYLYSDEDVARLLEAAARLAPQMRAATCVAVIGLLAATGLRAGEALGLAIGDVDLAAGVLTITKPKLDRPRLIPLHPTVTAALAGYAALRSRMFPRSTAFFVSSTGTPLAYSTLRTTFNQLATATGLRIPERRPHLHDFRHRFAVRVLAEAYRSGADAAARMAVLSAYLGHADPAHTYWYLSAAPELMQLAAARLTSQKGARP